VDPSGRFPRANTNVRNSEGQTPLHRILVKIEDKDILGAIQLLLLEHGADVDALDNDHSTPLHLASQYGSVRATQLLLEYGANVHLQNNDGHTPSRCRSIRRLSKICDINQSNSSMKYLNKIRPILLYFRVL